MRAGRGLGLTALLAVLVAGLLPSTALASPPDPSVSVTLVLSPTSAQALHALASAHGLSRRTRTARLAALVPGAARHHSVAQAVAGLGLRLSATSDWSVTVTGPANTVRALFGTAHTSSEGLTGAYAEVPAAFAGTVVAALPSSGRAARPLAPYKPRGLTGDRFRAEYDVPATADGTGLTVATVQLSGWNAPDLTTYAKSVGIADPVAAGRYQPVEVEGCNGCSRTSDDQGGDAEVALDQESILSSAPGAKQRAYFARNDDAGKGFADAIRQVGTDATADPSIAALSLSWGGCEIPGDRNYYAMMDQAIEFTVAAGVTVFAATGDWGSDDCGAGTSTVDYPASSPFVVGVGGTRVTATSTIAWSGSGGGESSVEALPPWQRSVTTAEHRLVPDIASDADPSTGFDVYNSYAGGWRVIGGTSLASPTQAALLVDTLAANGGTTGIGDIHAALYAAPRTAFTDVTSGSNGAFSAGIGFDRVTGLGSPKWSALAASLGQFSVDAPIATRSTSVPATWSTPLGGLPYRGWSAPVVDGSSDCSTTSATTKATVSLPAVEGWHTITVAGLDGSAANGGAGACRIATARVLLDRAKPSATASLRVGGAHSAVARWAATDPAPASGIRRYVVTIANSAGVVWSATTTARSHTFDPRGYSSYRLTVTAVDAAGNSSAAVAARLFDDVAFTYSAAHWRSVTSAAAYRGSQHVSDGSASSKASATIYPQSSALYVTTCPSCGKLAVYSNGHLIKVVDTYSSSTRHLVAIALPAAARPLTRTLGFRALHLRNARSTGYTVSLDALAVA